MLGKVHESVEAEAEAEEAVATMDVVECRAVHLPK
jgi:hypothetical protein